MLSSIRRAAAAETCRYWINSTFKCVRSYTILAAEAMRLKLPHSGEGIQRYDARPMVHLTRLKIWHPSRGILFSTDSKTRKSRKFTSSSSDKASSSVIDPPDKSLTLESASEVPSTLESATVFDDEYEVGEDLDQDKLPQSDSHFKMKEELFRAAKAAEPGAADSYWSHRLYRGPIVNGQPTRPVIHYCRSSQSTEKVLQTYFMDQKVIGFDLEWRIDALRFHGPRANVSLIQIASEERIALLHVALYPKNDDLVSPSLRKLMEDETVSKVGVSIKADCTRFKKFLGVECRGLFELSHLFKLVKYSQSKDFKSINKRLVSLAKQVQDQLHLPLFKGDDVRSSDWSKKLDIHQLIYAASDSYAAVQLYKTMEMKRKALVPTPPRPSHAELNIPIKFGKEIQNEGEPEIQVPPAVELDQANKVEEEEEEVQVNKAVQFESEIQSQSESQSVVADIHNDVELNQPIRIQPDDEVEQSTQHKQEINVEASIEIQPVLKLEETTQDEPNILVQQDVAIPFELEMPNLKPKEPPSAQLSRDAFFSVGKLPATGNKTQGNKKSMPLAARMGGGELEATLRAQGTAGINKSAGTQYWTL